MKQTIAVLAGNSREYFYYMQTEILPNADKVIKFASSLTFEVDGVLYIYASSCHALRGRHLVELRRYGTWDCRRDAAEIIDYAHAMMRVRGVPPGEKL